MSSPSQVRTARLQGYGFRGALPAQAKANPDLTLAEYCDLFEEAEGTRVSTVTRAAFQRLGLTLNKAPFHLRARTSLKGRASACHDDRRLQRWRHSWTWSRMRRRRLPFAWWEDLRKSWRT